MPRLTTATVLLVLPVFALVAAESPFLAADADPVLAHNCRKLLAGDPRFSGLSLGVDVVNRVAVVGGPVPSAEVGPQVEALLSTVPGLEAVKLSCWVPATADPLIDRIGEKLRGDVPPVVLPERVPVTRDANGLPPLVMLPHAAEPPRRVPEPRPEPRAEPEPSRRDPPPPPVATVTRYAANGWLGEPIADSATRLAGLLAEARLADRRFLGLRADAKLGVVRVSGRVREHADTWDYVAEVRRIPGVTRVVVGLVVAD